MCGIFGYVGQPVDTGTLVLGALRRLEYRGYDSWGIGVAVDGHLAIEKHVGKIGNAEVDFPESAIGFGHTRWATHGGVTQRNAHPHSDESGRIAVIHNGIIENFRELKAELVSLGFTFRSETDTEIVAHLITSILGDNSDPNGMIAAVSQVFNRLAGLNAIIVLDQITRTLTAVKNVSPLVIGRRGSNLFIASDPLAFADQTDEVLYPDDGQVVQLSALGIRTVDALSALPMHPSWQRIAFDIGSTELGDFPHYMIKEIYEQSAVIERMMCDGAERARILASEIRNAYGTFLVGCGTASYAALSGSYLFSRIAKWHVNFVLGSEFGYQEHFLTDRSLVAALSQSGETADVIQSILAAKKRNSRIAALVNVRGSTLDRIADASIYLDAGPEQCVLSTKAYVAKLALLLYCAHILNDSEETGRRQLQLAIRGIEAVLNRESQKRIASLAELIAPQSSMFVIGRGLSYPTALEAALKIKEVSYIHAEGFAGGELKHGVIALIEEGIPCLVFAPEDETRSDILSGAMELKSRGGFIIGVSSEPDEVFDVHLPVMDAEDANPLVMVVPAQLLGYNLALIRGLDPDKPRNLAKSVTVK